MSFKSYYHVAPRRDREEIAEYGLSVDIPERNHPWCNRGIYVFGNLEAAKDWATGNNRGYSEPADIWEVSLEEDELYYDEYREVRPDEYQDSWVSGEDIEADKLKLVSLEN